MPLSIGDDAPDFTLKDHLEKDFHAGDRKGRRVLLSFHPLAWTDICAKQMLSLENSQGVFEAHNAVAVGISVDSTFSKKAWAESLGIAKTRLLSDFWPHGHVASLYHIFWEDKGISERANVIVGEDGNIAFVKVYGIHQLPDVNEVLNFIKSMK